MNGVKLTSHTLLTAWRWGPFALCVLAVAVAVAVWYHQADWKLAARGRRWPWHRRVSFLLGLFTVVVALQGPVATFAGSYFQAHAVQHILLMIIAPVLLALGAPSTLLLQTASRPMKKRWLRVLRSRPFAAVTYPVFVWLLYVGGMYAFFLSNLVNYSMEHMALMDLINLVFLLSGCLYWWPMVGLDPIRHWKMGYGAKLLNLFLATPFEAFLGIAIMTNRQPVASMYSVASSHAGGGILWMATEVASIAGLIPIYFQWIRSDERVAKRADARVARAARIAALGGEGPAAVAGAPGAPVPVAVPAAVVDDGTWNALFQPGNREWERIFRSKAGFVPSQTQASPPPA